MSMRKKSTEGKLFRPLADKYDELEAGASKQASKARLSSVFATLCHFLLGAIKELYNILFKSKTAWDHSKDKIRAAHRGSINSGYFGSNAHGDVDLPWLKEEQSKK